MIAVLRHTGLICVTLFELLFAVLSPTTKPSCRALMCYNVSPALPLTLSV